MKAAEEYQLSLELQEQELSESAAGSTSGQLAKIKIEIKAMEEKVDVLSEVKKMWMMFDLGMKALLKKDVELI